MRVLVVSDTHIPVTTEILPEVIKEEAGKSDCCLHAGDFIAYRVFEELSALTTVYGVSGNMDSDEVRQKLPLKNIIKLEGVTIGLIHGRGAPSGLLEYVDKEFSSQRDTIDIFIFGHSHRPMDKQLKSKVYFNPGSPTDEMFTPYRSYGVLDIKGKKNKRRVMKIE